MSTLKYSSKPKRRVLLTIPGNRDCAAPFQLPRVYGRDFLPRADAEVPKFSTFPDLRVYQYNDVALMPSHVVLDGDLSSVYSVTFTKHRHQRHEGVYHRGDDVFELRNPIRRDRVRFVAGTSYYLDSEFPNSYGHNLLEVLPQVWAQNRLNFRNIKYVMSVDTPGYIVGVLDYLGIPRDKIVRIDGLTRCERLIVPAPAVVPRTHVHPVAREVFSKIAGLQNSIYDDDLDRVRSLGRKIYVSRSGVPGRGLINEGAVERLVESAGFSIIHPEQFSVAEQVAIFSRASHVVGPVGSGMHNAVFGQDLKVLILASDGWLPLADMLLSQGSYDLRYVFGSRVAPEDSTIRSQEPWRIAVDSLRRALDDFLSD